MRERARRLLLKVPPSQANLSAAGWQFWVGYSRMSQRGKFYLIVLIGFSTSR